MTMIYSLLIILAATASVIALPQGGDGAVAPAPPKSPKGSGGGANPGASMSPNLITFAIGGLAGLAGAAGKGVPYGPIPPPGCVDHEILVGMFL
jgi:hypothetical protein